MNKDLILLGMQNQGGGPPFASNTHGTVFVRSNKKLLARETHGTVFVRNKKQLLARETHMTVFVKKYIPTPAAPDTVVGLQLWLDAADSSTLFDSTTGGLPVVGGGKVARWEDKSGNANHATQGTANERPLRKTNDTNGNDVVLFDGANDWFSLASGLDLSGDVTIFTVIKRNASGINNPVLASQNSLVVYASYWYNDDIIYYTAASSSVRFISSTVSTDTGVFLLESQNHTNKTTPSRIFKNGTEVASGSIGTSIETYNSVGFRDKNSGEFMDGEICEIVHYNRELSSQEVLEVRNYLANKWGITLN